MFDLIHQMRARLISSPSFTGDKVIATILFEQTMDRTIDGEESAAFLWKQKHIVPFVKVDQGLSDAENGVQLMKPMTKLDSLLERAVDKGIFGTKMRSFIQEPNDEGIKAIVDQQFEYADTIAAAGLMPIIEPEVSIKSPDKPKADSLLVAALSAKLDELPGDRQVMLKLTLPDEDNLYAPLIDHPRVLRVVALSGGYSLAESCAILARNHAPDRELLAGVDRGADRPADRRGIRREARVEHRGDLRRVGDVTAARVHRERARSALIFRKHGPAKCPAQALPRMARRSSAALGRPVRPRDGGDLQADPRHHRSHDDGRPSGAKRVSRTARSAAGSGCTSKTRGSSRSRATRTRRSREAGCAPRVLPASSWSTRPGRQLKVLYRAPRATEWQRLDLDTAIDMVADRFVESRRNTWQDIDKKGNLLRRTMGIASLGGATLDNEENYLIKKLFTAAGAIQIENQARI